MASPFEINSASDVEWFGSTGNRGAFNITSSSSVQFFSFRRRTARCEDAFTFDPLGGPAWAGEIRRNPEIIVQKAHNDSPSSMNFTDETEPELGQNVQLDMGDGFGVLGGGTVQCYTTRYEGQRTQLVHDLDVADYLWLLNKRRPFATFVDTPADVVAMYLFNNFAPFGYTASGIVADLPNVTVTFDGTQTYTECMSEIASQIAGHFRVDHQKIISLFLDDPETGPSVIDDVNPYLLRENQITIQRDASQLRNRVFVSGDAANLMQPTLPGATVLEVDGIDIYNPDGGQGIINGDVFSYTGFERTLIYPPPDASSFTPGALIAVPDNNQCGRIKTRVRYRVAFVIDGKASQLGPISNVALINQVPATGGSISSIEVIPGAGQVPNGASQYIFGWADLLGGIVAGGTGLATSAISNPTQAVIFHGVVTHTDPRVGARITWRRELVGATLYRETVRNNPLATDVIDVKSDASLGAIIPPDGINASQYNTTGSKSFFYGVPLGPAGTTARRIYRQEAYDYDIFALNNENWTEPELCLTIEDNVTQGTISSMIEDTKPTRVFSWSDEVNPGNPLPAPPPPPPPKVRLVLLGVTGLQYAHEEGDPVAIFIQRDDFDSQLDRAQAEGGDGVHEYFIADSSLRSDVMLANRGDAELTLFAQPIITVTYSTREKTDPGATLVFNLSDPPIVGTLKAVQVSIDKIHVTDSTNPFAPRYNVTASSVKFTLQDLLRRVLLRVR